MQDIQNSIPVIPIKLMSGAPSKAAFSDSDSILDEEPPGPGPVRIYQSTDGDSLTTAASPSGSNSLVSTPRRPPSPDLSHLADESMVFVAFT